MIKDIYDTGFDGFLTRETAISKSPEELDYQDRKNVDTLIDKNLQIYKEGEAHINSLIIDPGLGDYYIGDVRIQHNLGYVPLFEVFGKVTATAHFNGSAIVSELDGNWTSLPYVGEFPTSSQYIVAYDARATTTELIINVAIGILLDTMNRSVPIDFYYYIYRDKIE